jgi:hypothetical protein
MPLPKPTSKETRGDFVKRCMGTEIMKTEFPVDKQRLAICISTYEKKEKEMDQLETQSDKVSKNVETTLKNKLKDHREKVGDAASKQTTLRKLKIVFNRGVGAWKTSPAAVRPSVRGPEQWAYGRVNSFLKALRTGRYQSGKHDTDLLPTSHPHYERRGKKADAHRKYPDGEPIPSNLPAAYRPAREQGPTKKQACVNCKFWKEGHEKHRYYCTKWRAPVRSQYWCAKWKPGVNWEGKLEETYDDYPESAVNAAKRALEYKDKNPDNKCGTPVGWARANQLANREKLSRTTIARMASFKRHQQHKDVPYSEGCGGLMWDAWGGTSGVEWAIRKLKEIDNKSNNKMSKYGFSVHSFDETAINSEEGIMSGVSLISVGEAKGHELFVDEDSIESILSVIKDTKLPSYLTHRGALFEDRLTKEIGYFNNFRIKDNKIVGDFHAFKSFKDDDAKTYRRLFEMAEQIPERFGLSIVFSANQVWATEKGDVETLDKPDDALFEYPSIRVNEVMSADFVDTPAANEKGLFSLTNKSIQSMTKAELIEINKKLSAENEDLKAELATKEFSESDESKESEVEFAAHEDEKLEEHEELEESKEEELEEHEEEEKLEDDVEELKSLLKDLEDKLKEKDEKISELEEKLAGHEEEEKKMKEKEEELTTKLSASVEEVTKLSSLIKGSTPVKLSAEDDTVWKPGQSQRAEIIKQFAKENNISEFTATLRLGKEKPELFKS